MHDGHAAVATAVVVGLAVVGFVVKVGLAAMVGLEVVGFVIGVGLQDQRK